LFSETYQYYDLPFCRTPDGLEHKPETLGEVRPALTDPDMIMSIDIAKLKHDHNRHARWYDAACC